MAKIDISILKEELMSNKETTTAISPKVSQSALAETDPEYFKPTAKQRKLKAAFRAQCKDMPSDRTLIKPDFVKKYIKTDDITNWWNIPGFASWFRREEAVAERLQYLYHLRLDAVEAVLEDEAGIYTAKDKIAAGAELDKIAKTLVDAADAVDKTQKDTRSMEDKIKDAYDKAKQNATQVPVNVTPTNVKLPEFK